MLRQQGTETIFNYVSQKNATKVMEKVAKAKLSARAVEALNLYLDQFLVQMVKQQNASGKYGITHYQYVLNRLIPDKELLKRCTDDAKSRSTQMITGLSLDFVMSAQDRVKTTDSVDTISDEKPNHRARYLSHMRRFVVSCGLLCPKQCHSAFTDRPGAQYFSLPVGLFIANAIEQLARFLLHRTALSVAKEKLSSISADRIAYIFFHDPLINQLASETRYFQSLEVKTFKALTVDDSNLPSLNTSQAFFADSHLYEHSDNGEMDAAVSSPRSSILRLPEAISSETSLFAEPLEANPVNQLSDHLSTNLSINNDRSRDFEELFNSGRTVKLSLTPSRLRKIAGPEDNVRPSNSSPVSRRSSLISCAFKLLHEKD
ncbi:hypothetical protein DSO57_1020116 [Entomophthora muscae]|uniref:Uncharacterized protein n=1 Tax=Entomophthora muscae TaxID=34485 RepID=A0ACC2SSL3_9FUNG|nr:hypothetical protein DSO57_1020116 [Entomophthora muscae]